MAGQERHSAQERRAQILDEALALFITKGYQRTTIEDILSAVGIAKGTLYHHFRSKEAILEAIVLRTCERAAERARAIASGEGTALERFLKVLASARVQDDEERLVEQFHAPGNAEFRLMSIVEMIRHLAPVLTELVEEGQGTDFHVDRPREAVEILLAAGGILLDGGIFEDGPELLQARAAAIFEAGERLLGVPAETLAGAQRP